MRSFHASATRLMYLLELTLFTYRRYLLTAGTVDVLYVRSIQVGGQTSALCEVYLPLLSIIPSVRLEKKTLPTVIERETQAETDTDTEREPNTGIRIKHCSRNWSEVEKKGLIRFRVRQAGKWLLWLPPPLFLLLSVWLQLLLFRLYLQFWGLPFCLLMLSHLLVFAFYFHTV